MKKNTGSDVTEIEGTFTVLGTVRKKKRTEYKIKMFKHGTNEVGNFWCSCPSHKYHSIKKDIVCKHICFIVCKVSKILSAEYFATKQLTRSQFNKIKKKGENINNLLNDTSLCKRLDHNDVTLELFKRITRPITEDDLCPICYYEMNENQVLSCPRCSNNVHKDCMMIWLEKSKTCVYCRDDIWKKYKPIL